MFRPRPLHFVALATALLAGGILFAAMSLLSARRTLHRAAVQVVEKNRLPYTLRSLDPAQLAAANPGFEPIAARAIFVSGAFFEGGLYLSGPTGLFSYSSEGVLRKSWRTGIDLPAAPLGAMAVGRLRDSTRSELLIATAGEGILMLQVDPRGQPTLRQLRPADPELRDISALLPLPTGDLLIGTRHRGLFLYSGSTLEPLPLQIPGLDARSLQITALAADATGFWAGTFNAGVLRSWGGTVERIDASSGLPDPQVESIEIHGRVAYIATPLGVAQVDRDTFRVERILAPNLFAHALTASPRLLTIGSIDQGIQVVALDAKLRPQPVSLIQPESGSAEDSVEQFLQAAPGDPESPVYAITRSALLRRTTAGWTPVIARPPDALSDRNISALAFAPDGRLWVGFFDSGLDILSPTLEREAHLEDDRLFCINRLVLDPQRETMAAATANGLVLFDAGGKPRQTLTHRDGLIADHVTDVAFTPQGMTLATPAGLTFVDRTGTQSLYAFQGLVNNHVYALGSAGDQLLAGTLGGLSVLQSETVQRSFTVHNSTLRHNWITAIVPIGQGDWMIGTYGAGVMRLTAAGSFEPMDLATSSTQQIVVNPNAMLATATHIFAGTLGRGLLIYTRASGHWTAVTSGLPSQNVTALAEHAGQLYVGTENGLVRIAEGSVVR